MNIKKVLLIQADTTQTLPMARELSKKGYEVHAVVSCKLTYGYGCRFVRKKFIFKDYENVDEYFKFILDILKKDNYSILIPMADHGAMVLSKYKDKLSEYVKFTVPDFSVFEKGFDKEKLMSACQKGNYPHPRTVIVDSDNLDDTNAKNLKYPVLIKPNQSCGARGITPVADYNTLRYIFPKIVNEYGSCHIQEYIPEGGAQVEAQLYVDKNGNLVQSSVIYKYRWYPNKGGSSCCNRSCENPGLIDTLHRLLKDIGWVGFADFDTIEDPRTGELLIMELNPRVPACVKTNFAAGINWADVISSEYEGLPHKKYSMEREAYLRHLGFETLWFLNAKNKFSTKPSWFKFFGKNIFYQDMSGWSDPKAFIYGTFGNILKQLSPSFRKAKSGMN